MPERPVALITTTPERIVPLVLPACQLAQASLVVVQTVDALLDCLGQGILDHAAPPELETAMGQQWMGRSRDLRFAAEARVVAEGSIRGTVLPA